jgi:hypothetical protein
VKIRGGYAYILQGRRLLGLGPGGLPVGGGLLVERDLRRAGPQDRWVADALGWATGKAVGIVVGVLGVGGMVVGGVGVLGAGQFGLVEIGSAGEDVLDQTAGRAPGLNRWRGLLLLLLLLLMLLLLLKLLVLGLVRVVGLLMVELLVVSEGRLRRGIVVGLGKIFEGGTEGGGWLDRGGYLVVSLGLRSGNSISEVMHSLAFAGVSGIEWLQLVQLVLVMGRRVDVVVWARRRGGGSGGVGVR